MSISFLRIKFQFLTDSTDFKKPCERKAKILLLTYAKFAYMQNLRICKSFPCVQGFRRNDIKMSDRDKHNRALGLEPSRLKTKNHIRP